MRKIIAGVFILSFSIVVLNSIQISSVLGEGTYSAINTSNGNDGSADAINFSQGRVWTIDQYGKYIWLTEGRGSGIHSWAWSNDLGATWTQGSESYGFLTRGSVAYDSINDKLHVIWTADASSDGIIYRRYGVTRDGTNNITAISREDSTNINLQLDTSASRSLEESVALWVNDGSTNGILVAIWSKSGGSLNEVRASMRVLSLSAADGVAGNWVALDGTADTFSTDAPAVAADKIFGDTTGVSAASALVRGGTGSRKDDLYVIVAEQDGTSEDTVLAYRTIWNSSNSSWSDGWQSPVTLGAMDTSSGYGSKYQLITKPVLDTTNDRLYVGWARWKDNTNGDTVSFAYLNSTDTASSTVDAYSSLGTHSYAPTLDIAFDNTLGNLYVSYIESTTNGDNGSINYKTYNGSTLSSATKFYTSPGGTGGQDGSADIPILYENRSSNNRILFAFRANGALPPTAEDPHVVYWGYESLATPTSTPTVTPTPTNTPTPTPTPIPSLSTSTLSSSTSSSSSVSAPVCTEQKPPAPELYAASAEGTDKIRLFFTDPGDGYNKYVIRYGLKNGNYIFGADPVAFNGDRTTVIEGLSPRTSYYFQLRTQNGCMPGDWSNELSLTTNSFFVQSQPNHVTTTEVIPRKEQKPVEETKEIEKQNPQENKLAQKTSVPLTHNIALFLKNEKNEPLKGIQVTLHSTPQTTTTDSEGKATFTNVDSGEHRLVVNDKNYQGEQDITVGGDTSELELVVTVRPNRWLIVYYIAAGFAAAFLVIFIINKVRKLRT